MPKSALHESVGSSVVYIAASSCLALPSCQKHVGREEVLRVET